MLEKLKLLLDISNNEQDALLALLIERATAYVLNYTRRTQLPDQLGGVVIELATMMFNRRGAEGEQGRSEGGVSHTFYVLGDDVPKSIQEQMNTYRFPLKARVI